MSERDFQGHIVSLLFNLRHLACHGQVEPDGENCTICGDNDHQAPECELNAFHMFKTLKKGD